MLFCCYFNKFNIIPKIHEDAVLWNQIDSIWKTLWNMWNVCVKWTRRERNSTVFQFSSRSSLRLCFNELAGEKLKHRDAELVRSMFQKQCITLPSAHRVATAESDERELLETL